MKNFEQWIGSLAWWEVYLGVSLFCTFLFVGKELVYPYKKSNGRGK